VDLIRHLQENIDDIEKVVKKKVKLKEEFAKLLTMPGIGEILTLTIMLEVGHIDRFPTVGDYSSKYFMRLETVGRQRHKKRHR
jgi:transposase